MVLGYKHWAKDPRLALPPRLWRLHSRLDEASLDLGDRTNPTRLGQKPRVSRTRMVPGPRKLWIGQVLSHGVNLLKAVLG